MSRGLHPGLPSVSHLSADHHRLRACDYMHVVDLDGAVERGENVKVQSKKILAAGALKKKFT